MNCPALSGDLMTSALFGHRKGAFTGAVADVAGKVQEAEGGTLLLDEVGELTADAQARLLRFLNDRTYERLGEARERQADVRLIAATNRDLEAEVRAGRFREDLFYRLNVVTLTLPALRERPEDILLLAHHYLSIFGQKQRRPGLDVFGRRRAGDADAHAGRGISVSCETPSSVPSFSRPAMCWISPTSDSRPLSRPMRTVLTQAARASAHWSRIESLEREHIARVVAQSPSLEAAARILDIDATTLQRKRKRYGLA